MMSLLVPMNLQERPSSLIRHKLKQVDVRSNFSGFVQVYRTRCIQTIFSTKFFTVKLKTQVWYQGNMEATRYPLNEHHSWYTKHTLTCSVTKKKERKNRVEIIRK